MGAVVDNTGCGLLVRLNAPQSERNSLLINTVSWEKKLFSYFYKQYYTLKKKDFVFKTSKMQV